MSYIRNHTPKLVNLFQSHYQLGIAAISNFNQRLPDLRRRRFTGKALATSYDTSEKPSQAQVTKLGAILHRARQLLFCLQVLQSAVGAIPQRCKDIRRGKRNASASPKKQILTTERTTSINHQFLLPDPSKGDWGNSPFYIFEC
jgi:hypothetical protein